jgi:S1-C subfamily serine protease
MTRLPAACAALALALTAVAAERPDKKKPDGTPSYDEAAKVFPVGDKQTSTRTRYVAQTVTRQVVVNMQVQVVTETVMVPVTETVAVVVPKRRWSLGATGWHDHEGFNVERLAADSPLAKVRVLDGNKETFYKVEAKDVIAKIDGQPVASELALYMGVQGAGDKGTLTVEVISAKDGKTYTGTVTATKAK